MEHESGDSEIGLFRYHFYVGIRRISVSLRTLHKNTDTPGHIRAIHSFIAIVYAAINQSR